MAHPDLNQSKSAEEEFRLLKAAYDCLRDEGKRAAYDSNKTHNFAQRARRQHAMRRTRTRTRGEPESAAARAQEEGRTRERERRMAREYGTTVAEVSIRALIHAGNIREAIQAWSALGAPLDLCEFLLEQCRLTRQFPEDGDLKAMLDALHASEVPQPGSYSYSETGVQDMHRAVAVFVEEKTHIYNALICVANRIATVHTVLKIVDEMDRRDIEKDAETLDFVLWALGCGSYGDSSRG